MGHAHEVRDTDKHFKINPVTREVSNASETKQHLFKGDHNSERFTFELPRKIDDHDMSTCDKIEVHYINTDAKVSSEYTADIYLVDDVAVSENDDELVTFSWLISGNATRHIGKLSFAIRFICTDENGEYSYIWNTAVHAGITIIDSITNDDLITNIDSDAYRQWEAKFFENVSNVEVLETPTETTNILVEDSGVMKKIPANSFGSENSELAQRVDQLSEEIVDQGKAIEGLSEEIAAKYATVEIRESDPETSEMYDGRMWIVLDGAEEPDVPVIPENPLFILRNYGLSFGNGVIEYGFGTNTRISIATLNGDGIAPAISVGSTYVTETAYPIPVPDDATSVTVACDGLMWGVAGFTYKDGTYAYDLDPGWRASGATVTFEAGSIDYVVFNLKDANNGNIPDSYDTSGIVVTIT